MHNTLFVSCRLYTVFASHLVNASTRPHLRLGLGLGLGSAWSGLAFIYLISVSSGFGLVSETAFIPCGAKTEEQPVVCFSFSFPFYPQFYTACDAKNLQIALYFFRKNPLYITRKRFQTNNPQNDSTAQDIR